MTQPRLFTGIIQLRKDTMGSIDLQNDTYVGWHADREAALGTWIPDAMANHPGYSVSYQAAYDVTDTALQQLEWPTEEPLAKPAVSE